MHQSGKRLERYIGIEKRHDDDILLEAEARIEQRRRNYIDGNITEQKAELIEKNPFLKELYPVNGYPITFVIRRLSHVHSLPNHPKYNLTINDQVEDTMKNISDLKNTICQRAVAVESLRSAFVCKNHKNQLVQFVRGKEFRMILSEALQTKMGRPLVEETCFTLMHIFYSVGSQFPRKTSAILAKVIIGEMAYYLTDITNHCDRMKAAKMEFLDKKLILGDKAKDLRFWFPNFRVKRASYSVHHPCFSLLFYTLAFLLFHTHHLPAAFEVAFSTMTASKPLQFYLLNILDVCFGYFHFTDLMRNPKLPKHICNCLSSLCDSEEAKKDEVRKKLAASCCRKLYAECQNTQLHFRLRNIDGKYSYCEMPIRKTNPEDTDTSSESMTTHTPKVGNKTIHSKIE